MANWHNSAEWSKARAYAKTILEPQCVVCDRNLTGADWTIDHVVPAGTEGEPNHDISNLQSMCRQCNGRKQDKTQIRQSWSSPRWA